MILVGGQGSRLRSVVADRPKPLAEVDGRPFLTYLFDQLLTAGLSDVVLCVGYRGAQVRETFGDSYGHLRLKYSEESTPLGTGGAVRAALPLSAEDPLFVLNGDSFFDLDFSALAEQYRSCAASAVLALAHVDNTERFGRVTLDALDRIQSFEEKGVHRGKGWINAGVYLLSHSLLQAMPTETVVSLERDCFPHWIGAGLYGLRGAGKFLDIGTPESYATAVDFFAPQRKVAP
jgi:NDP-sugar pyrophosphorylase family protein